jgi:hypothetical protein
MKGLVVRVNGEENGFRQERFNQTSQLFSPHCVFKISLGGANNLLCAQTLLLRFFSTIYKRKRYASVFFRPFTNTNYPLAFFFDHLQT